MIRIHSKQLKLFISVKYSSIKIINKNGGSYIDVSLEFFDKIRKNFIEHKAVNELT